MNFSAEKARRKWPCGGLGLRRMANGYRRGAAAGALCRKSGPAAAARRPGAWSQGPWGELFGARSRKLRRGRAARVGAAAEAASGGCAATGPEAPAAAKPAPAETDKPAEQAAPAPPPPSACRLALTEEIAIAPSIPDIHGARRLRRRGSGAAGGRGAAGQAAGRGQARGDPALHDGLRDRGLDPHRHGAAGGKPRQRHQRSRQFQFVRMPRPQPRGRRPYCPNTAAPTRSTSAA